jgi:hypothetical protein
VNERENTSEGRALDVILRWPTSRARRWVETFLESAKHDNNIVAVVALGSSIRPAVQSVDLDLLVIAEDARKLKNRRPIEIDLRAYSSRDVDSLIQSGNDLLSWSLNFGKVLFERDDFWKTLVVSWKDRIPLPSHDQALARAQKSLTQAKEMIRSGDLDAASELAVSYLTHIARAELLSAKVYPTSRPELPSQLRTIGLTTLAECLELALRSRPMSQDELKTVLDVCHVANNDQEPRASALLGALTSSLTKWRLRDANVTFQRAHASDGGPTSL